ncbi:MAG: Taurine transport system permease protein TauC [Brockia lithotrophica]|uniref:Taurine transport system permease protein TauC n=1 Tax=Brockia lithotrophica TaxID=933949 RepID=A0A2T5G8J9_9BACL|nr:MAG: Taurine transport system permease protein TauC [Brockia lithotrophica]
MSLRAPVRLFVAFGVLFGLWWGIAMLLHNPVFPPPPVAFRGFLRLWEEGLVHHVGASLKRVGVATAWAVLMALPLGLFLGTHPRWDERIAPYVYLTYPIPKTALMPVFFLLLGLGDLSKEAILFLILFYQLLIVVRDAARTVDPAYVLSVRALGARPWDLYRHVYLPAALPALLTALRVNTGIALSVLFLVETYATEEGLGYLIQRAQSRYAYGEIFAVVALFGFLGLILYVFLDVLEALWAPWARRRKEGELVWTEER